MNSITSGLLSEQIYAEYRKGLAFNSSIGLDGTVKVNEDFFIGKQWEGVDANGLPTPVFNFLKRVVLFTVASITSDNLKLHASALSTTGSTDELRTISEVVNAQFEQLMESNKIVCMLREFMRNAAVDGDGCTYTYWDPDIDTGHPVKGAIVTEVIENTRVFFGNANSRHVQSQPYIIIARREMVDSVRKRAIAHGCKNADDITADGDDGSRNSRFDTDDKVTVLLKMWRDDESGTIHAAECTRSAVIREPWDMKLTLYPITWLNWDYIPDCYHGQAMVTGLIPNQVFINKMFAMSMISLMTTAYPKIVYDKTRVAKWDNRVGAAIGIAGGDVNTVAKIIDPAQVSPQIAQFIQLTIDTTQTFLGATSVALGEARPDNTSAIIALQRASATPHEITRQNLYQSLEDLGRIYVDFMSSYYGRRSIELPLPEEMAEIAEFANTPAGQTYTAEFDFDTLRGKQLSIRLDVGTSSYWSEVAAIQTLDNLMSTGKITLEDYLERVPEGYITKKQELLDKVRQDSAAAGGAPVDLTGLSSMVGGAQMPLI